MNDPNGAMSDGHIRGLRDKHSRHMNAAEIAYWTIRDAIRTGFIAPGERLIELDLAASLEMSRTPVRDALRRLATERLIETAGRRGYVVPTTTIEELVDLFEIRGALEGLAARRAALRMGQAEIDAMQDTLRRMDQAFETDDLTTLSSASTQFHRLLRAGSRDNRLGELIVLVTDAVPGIGAHEMAPDRVAIAIAEHHAICDAVANRQPDEAERLTRVHAEHALAAQIRAHQLAEQQ
jgi:DNA-binding GntR family transcriptional regulator